MLFVLLWEAMISFFSGRDWWTQQAAYKGSRPSFFDDFFFLIFIIVGIIIIPNLIWWSDLLRLKINLLFGPCHLMLFYLTFNSEVTVWVGKTRWKKCLITPFSLPDINIEASTISYLLLLKLLFVCYLSFIRHVGLNSWQFCADSFRSHLNSFRQSPLRLRDVCVYVSTLWWGVSRSSAFLSNNLAPGLY